MSEFEVMETDGALGLAVTFKRQPHAIPARHRVAYRTSLLVLVLSRFNQGAARLDNVHLFSWASRSQRTRHMLQRWWEGKRFISTSTVRMDPDLDQTVRLARADGLIENAGANRQRLRLTERGWRLAELIDEQATLLSAEKSFIDSFTRLSDGSVDSHLGKDRP